MSKLLFSLIMFLAMAFSNMKAATQVWSGTFTANNWSNVLELNGSIFSSLKSGDKVVLKGTTSGAAQIQIANSSWSSYIPDNSNHCDDFNGQYTVSITQTNLNFFQGGINVKGQNFTLTSVSIESVGGSTGGGSTSGSKIWSGSFDSANWAKFLDIDGSKFSALQVGDKVVFQATTTGEAKIQLNDNGWTSTIPENQYNCAAFNGTYTVTITNSNLNFFQGGIHVKGENFILTSVSIESNGGGSTGGSTGGQTSVATGAFHIQGTKLMDAKGYEFIMRGCNYSYAWQKGNEYSVIPAAKRIGCNTIRINISNGKKFSYCSKSEIEKLIKLCEDNKLVCVLCVHDALGSDKYEPLQKTVDYWKSIKDAIIGHENTVIINIANEWVAGWQAKSSIWQEGYVKAVKELRDAGFKNTLMIDCAGYGQYPGVIGTHGAAVVNADPLKNLMFSIHMYQYDAGTADDVRNNIDQALAVNVPLCIGEFSYSHQGSSVAYQTIMDYCQEKRVSYLVWSWTGNGGGAEACDMFGGYDENDVKENGKRTIWGRNGIKETSKECTIFDNSISAGIENEQIETEKKFDFNRPYTAYDLMGRMVKDMSAHGVYILRQGTVTIKVYK